VLEETLELVLTNAHHVKTVPGRKSDVNDAMWLADLLAHGPVRGNFVPPAHIQEVRDLSRTRKQLTREIIQHTNRSRRCSRTPTSSWRARSATCSARAVARFSRSISGRIDGHRAIGGEDAIQ
jgi:hypothetical protein